MSHAVTAPVAPLSLKEAQRLADHMNEQLERLPRIAANLLTHTVQATTQEIASCYRSNVHHSMVPTDEKSGVRMVSFHPASSGGLDPAMVGIAELLSAMCAPWVQIKLIWENGKPRFIAERGPY